MGMEPCASERVCRAHRRSAARAAPGEESNPDMLEQLKPMATSLLLKEGENRTIDLKLSAY
jgi:hypothetical protein